MNCIFAAFVIFSVTSAWATAPESFTVQGGLYESDGYTPLLDVVDFTIQVYDPTESCLLYEETLSNYDLAPTNGKFSIQLGKPLADPARGGNDPGLTMQQVFANAGVQIRGVGAPNCAPGYTPAANDARKLQISYYNQTTTNTVNISPMQQMVATPYALVAGSLDGMGTGDFIQINTAGSGVLTQANVENVFTSANYTELMALINGTSTQYTTASGGNFSPTSNIDFNGQRIVNLTDPSGAQDAATKNYADTTLAGLTMDGSVNTLGSGDSGTQLVWDGSQWTTTTGLSLGGLDTQVQFNDSGTLGGDAGLTYNKATGELELGGGLRVQDPGAGTSVVSISAPNGLGASYNLVLPSDDGAANEVLITDGSGNLSWVDATTLVPGDDLGNHTATATLDLNANNITMGGGDLDTESGDVILGSGYISGDGDAEGLQVDSSGNVLATTNLTVGNEVLAGGAVSIEDPDAGTNKVSLVVDNTIAGDYTITLPAALPGAGNLLQVDASGVVSWVDPTGVGNDNLGNHTATQDLDMAGSDVNLNGGFVSGDGDAEGLSVDASGDAAASGALTVAGNLKTDTALIIEDPNVGLNAVTISAPIALGASYNLVLPSDDGNNNDVLVTDGSGNLSWVDATTITGDNLGDHTATQNIALGVNYLSGDGGNEGLTIDASGNLTASDNLNVSGNAVVTGDTQSDSFTVGTNNVVLGANYISGDGNDEGLSVDASGNVTVSDNLTVSGTISIAGGTPGAGQVLTSDASGNATWEPVPSSADNLGNHTATQDLDLATNDLLNVGAATIGGALQITSGAPGAGKVLTSDASGNATWVTPGAGADDLGSHTATQDLDMGTNDIVNATNLTLAGTISIAGGTPGAGQVLTSDASGNATWEPVPSSADNLGNHTATQVLDLDGNNITMGGADLDTEGGDLILGAGWLSNDGSAQGLQIDASGNVTASNDLAVSNDADITNNLTVGGTISIAGGTPGAGQVLTSDASGNATWEPVPSSADNLGNHTATQVLDLDGNNITMGGADIDTESGDLILGAGWLSNDGSAAGLQIDASGNVTASNDADITNNLSIGGTISIAGGTPGAGQVLTSDASGNATWEPVPSSADNLGNHTATQILDLDGNNITMGGADLDTEGGDLILGAGWLSNDGSAAGLQIDASGNVSASDNLTVVGDLKTDATLIIEDPNVGLNAISVTAPIGLGASYSLVLPADDGNADEVLRTDGSGNLSWVDPNSIVSGDDLGNHTAGQDLDLATNDLLNVGAVTIGGAVQITSGTPSAGEVLTTDASGNATWEPVPSSADNLGNHTATQVLDLDGNNITMGGADLDTEGGDLIIGAGWLSNDGSAQGLQIDASGNVTASNDLAVSNDVDITNNLTVGGTISIAGGTPGAGQVLTSDASGNATWEPVPSSADNLGNHTATQTLDLDGQSVTMGGGLLNTENGIIQIGSGYLSGDGSAEGLQVAADGEVSTSGNAVIGGAIRIVGGTPGNGKVLTATDASGNAVWQTPGAGADDLGSHTAIQDIDMAGFEVNLNGGFISGDGDDEGISIDSSGDVTTSNNLLVGGTISIAGGTPGAGQVLTSDASGNATWEPVPSSADNLGNHTATQVLDLDGNNITMGGADIDTEGGDLILGAGWLSNDGSAAGLQIDASGNVTASNDLTVSNDADITNNLTVGGTISIAGGTPGAGQVLTSDASGNATWEPVPSSADNLGNHTATQVLDLDGNNITMGGADLDTEGGDLILGAGWLSNDGSAQGLQIDASGNVTLSGTISIAGGTPGAGQVLTSDASGNATWEPVPSSADNLGNHTATQVLDLDGNNITMGGADLDTEGGDLILGAGWLSNDGSAQGLQIDASGNVSASDNLTVVGDLKTDATLIIEDPNVGLNAISVTAPIGLGASYSLVLPADDGNADEVLRTDGSGNLSWVDPNSIVSGDDLGSHTAAQDIDLATNDLLNVGAVTIGGTVQITSGTPGAGQVLTSDASGNATWEPVPSSADNLGNHTAIQNIALDGNYLSGDGDSEGVFVDSDGEVGVGIAAPLANLHVSSDGSSVGGVRATSTALFTSQSGDSTIEIRSANSGKSGIYFGDQVGAAAGAYFSYDDTGGVFRFAGNGGATNVVSIVAGNGNISTVGSVISDTAFVLEEPDAGTQEITIQAPTTVASNFTLTLPNTPGNNNELLQTDGSGNLSWVDSTTVGNDNLGNHTATQALDMGSNDIIFSNGDVALGTGFISGDGDNEGLSVDGSGVVSTSSDAIIGGTIRIVGGTPGNGKVLTATDASGNATWQTPGAGADDLGSHTAIQDIDLAGFEITTNGGFISGDGDDEGMSVDASGNVTFTGTIKIEGGTPGAGKVLTSDSSGNAAWVMPGAGADDLGSHTAAQDLDMAGFEVALNGGYISGDGDDEGLSVDASGVVSVSDDLNVTNDLTAGNIIGQGDVLAQQTLSIEDPDLGTNKLSFAVANSIAADYTLTFPDALPVGNRILQSDSSGNLTWIDPSGVGNDNLGNHTATTTLDMDNNNIDIGTGIISGDGGTEGLSIDSDGNVTVTTLPGINASVFVTDGSRQSALQEQAVGTISDDYFLFLQNNTERARIDGSGDFNISNNLSIGGTISIAGGTPGAGQVLTSDASGNATWEPVPSSADNLGNHTATQNIALDGNYLSGDGSNEGIFVDSSGEVGIGTATPGYPLDVVADDTIGGVRVTMGDAANKGAFVGELNAPANTNIFRGIQLNNGGSGATSSALIFLDNRGVNPGIAIKDDTTDIFNVSDTGDVFGAGNLDIDGSGVIDGSLTIGSTPPTAAAKLNVRGNGDSSDSLAYIYNDAATNKPILHLRQQGAGGLAGNYNRGLLVEVQGHATDGNIADFAYWDGATSTSRLVVKKDGDVGVGVSDPDATLDVVGTLQYVDGNEANGYVLTSDASGNATWQAAPSGADNLGNHTATQNIALDGNYLSGDGSSEGIFVDPTGRVAIGNATPPSLLAIGSNSGTILSDGSNDVASSGVNIRVQTQDRKYAMGIEHPGSGANKGSGLLIRAGAGIYADSYILRAQDDSGSDTLAVRPGTVGIAETLPAARLSIGTGSDVLLSDGSASVSSKGVNIRPSAATGAYIVGIENPRSGAQNGHGLLIRAGRDAESKYVIRAQDDQGVDVFTAQSDGNVGVANNLTVGGTIKIEGGTPGAGQVLTSDASGNATWEPVPSSADNLGNHTATQALDMANNNIILGSGYLSGDGSNEGINIDANGHIGMGIAANGFTQLIVQSDSSAGTQANGITAIKDYNSTNLTGAISGALAVGNNDTTNNNYTAIAFVSEDTAATGYTFGTVSVVNTDHTAGTIDSDFVVTLRENNNLDEKFRVYNDGTVKIAGGSPGAGKILTATDASGNATWQDAPSGADNLGNHTATQNIDLATYKIMRGANNFMQGGTGNLNLSLGLRALNSVTTGASNVAIGEDSLRDLTTNHENVAVGFEAMLQGNGYANTAVGAYALQDVGALNDNVALGHSAAGNLTTGGGVTALGAWTMSAPTNVTGTIAVGNYTMWNASGGDQNTLVGNYSLATALATADFNVALGNDALRNISSGSQNIAVGYQTGDLLTTGSSNILIGHQVDPSANNASNELNIGDAITGDLATGDVTIANNLTVNGVVQIAGGTPAAGEVLTTDASGNATWEPVPSSADGLGNHTATQDIDMAGFELMLNGGYLNNDGDDGEGISVDGSGVVTITAASGVDSRLIVTDGSRISNYAEQSMGTVSNDYFTFITNDIDRARMSAAGNMMFGLDQDATVKLQVDGGTELIGTDNTTGDFITGQSNNLHIAYDNDEIQARNDGAVSELFLNSNGGDVTIGNAGSTVTIAGTLVGGGDDLGDHTASQNLDMANNTILLGTGWLSGDASGEGISVNASGDVTGSRNIAATGQINGGYKGDYTDGNALDFNNGNLLKTSDDCSTAVSLSNMQDGGSYTVIITNAVGNTCTFSHAGVSTWKFQPTNANVTSGHSIYTMLKAGDTVYVNWSDNW